jgi:cytochrome c-type biogenesis protein CcmH
MRCPVCQGLSVEDSHTDTAVAMKAETRELLAAGFSPEQTLSYFEASYGEFIRLAPRAEGFNLLVWIAPVALLLLGAAIVAFRVRRKGPAPAADPGAEPEEDEDPELAAYLDQVRDDVGQVLHREST